MSDKNQTVSVTAKYVEVQWQAVFKRSLAGPTENDLTMGAGRYIPIAFNAWNGFNKDIGMKKSISTWYFIYLEKPMEMKVYLIALGAIVLVGASELLLMRKWNSVD